MIGDLEQLDGLGQEMVRRVSAAGALLIWRAQTRSVRRIVVREGKPESSSIVSVSGHGVQVVSPEGRVALASRDDFRPEPALAILDRTLSAISANAGLELTPGRFPKLAPTRGREVPEAALLPEVDLGRAGRRLAELEAEIAGRVPGTSLRLSLRTERDAWRIFRSDGTDVLFVMPRCSVAVRATNAGNGARHGVSAVAFSDRSDVLWDEDAMRRFLRRAEAAARLATRLPDAPSFPAGSYPLVIDFGLAKGLAHEAFGHASEADGYRSSILATDGVFRSGEKVGPDHVSIIDEPVPGDHAWQPFSANGLPRQRAVLVDHGRLTDGLSDPWSAEPGGVRLTGAARAESFRHAPQPRMTNIRIELDEPLPAPGEFEDYGPEQVRDLIADAGLFRRHPKWVHLSGYSGGQVNSATGDFVFNCKAIYELSAGGVKLYKPAIFSGSMFGALGAIREGFGPLRLDAIGYCGKWGQSVPSSGGSHYFLALDPDPSVRLGGR